MNFDMNPADEDPHGECRHEIHRLQEINKELLAACESMLRTCGASEFWNGETRESLKLIESAIAKATGSAVPS